MLSFVTVPDGLGEVLEALRGAFGAPSFAVFTALVTGFLGGTGRRTVVRVWAAAGLAHVAHWGRAHWFLACAKWEPDTVGLLLVRLIVEVFAVDQVTVAVDDTLFHRYGRHVPDAFYQHDGSARGRDGIGRGNCFVICGIVVPVAWAGRAVCLPVLFRLYRKDGPCKQALAREMTGLLCRALDPRTVHVVADALYRSKNAWADPPGNSTLTLRLARNAVLHAPAPARTGRRGRPRTRGERLGTPADLAAHAIWRLAALERYGRVDLVHLAETRCLWYGSLGPRPVRVILVRDPGKDTLFALVTTDLHADAEQVVARYADRWSEEQSIKDGKDLMGIGDARNRAGRAVERTVPLMFLAQSILILWYHRHGRPAEDLADRRRTQPWYRHKSTASLDDALIAFRRARISLAHPAQSRPAKNPDTTQTCASAAA
jgi:DDE superfamily endonuclease